MTGADFLILTEKKRAPSRKGRMALEQGKRLDKREIYRTGGALFGTLLYALGINLFIVPIAIYSSGLMGICQLIRTILVEYAGLRLGSFDVAGLIYYAINVPMFFLAWKTMGRLFFIKTMLCIAAMTLFLTLIPIPKEPFMEGDRLTSCLIGGIVSGCGVGITLIMGASSGGVDILGLYLVKKRRSGGVGRVSLFINAVLYAVCFLLFDAATALYSIIVAVVDSFTIDKIHSQNINVEVKIISNKDLRPFEEEFMQQLGRGITKWASRGAYTNQEQTVLYIILSKYEVAQLKHAVLRYDPQAFIIISEGVQVTGNFMKKL
jgi:uncharacterized membrane-anchored protein YitT (DUF2179 family)